MRIPDCKQASNTHGAARAAGVSRSMGVSGTRAGLNPEGTEGVAAGEVAFSSCTGGASEPTMGVAYGENNQNEGLRQMNRCVQMQSGLIGKKEWEALVLLILRQRTQMGLAQQAQASRQMWCRRPCEARGELALPVNMVAVE